MDYRKEYGIVVTALREAFKPEDMKFTSLSEIHERTIYPGESPQKFIFELKRLLKKAFPEMVEEAREQLVFEQYIRGLPKFVYEKIRTSPDVRTSNEAMKRAQTLIRQQGEVQPQSSEYVTTIDSKTNTEMVDKGISIKETPLWKECNL